MRDFLAVLATGVLTSAVGAGDDPIEAFAATENQCAAWVAYEAASLEGLPATVGRVNALLPPDGKAKSLSELRDALDKLGVRSGAVRFADVGAAVEAVASGVRLVVPVLLTSGRRHFVVLTQVRRAESGTEFLVLDGPHGIQWWPAERVWMRWSGEALMLGDATTATRWAKPIGLAAVVVMSLLTGVVWWSRRSATGSTRSSVPQVSG